MHTFRDSRKHEWEITLNVGNLRRVQDVAGVDLLQVLESAPGQEGQLLLTRLATDPALMGRVLWALSKAQATEAGIGEEEFLTRLDGKAVASGTDALMGELRLFFDGLGRVELATAVGHHAELVQILARQLGAELAKVRPDPSYGPKSTDAPGLSGLIRRLSRWANFGTWRRLASLPNGSAQV